MNDQSDDSDSGPSQDEADPDPKPFDRPLRAFSALAQEHRMAVFRLPMQEFGREFAAGEIGSRLSIRPSNLSFHLAHLERAGLIRGRRAQRNVYYSADLHGVRELLSFIVIDICGRDATQCEGLLPKAQPR